MSQPLLWSILALVAVLLAPLVLLIAIRLWLEHQAEKRGGDEGERRA